MKKSAPGLRPRRFLNFWMQIFELYFEPRRLPGLFILLKTASEMHHECTRAPAESAIMEADGATSIIIIGGMTMDYTAGRGTTALGIIGTTLGGLAVAGGSLLNAARTTTNGNGCGDGCGCSENHVVNRYEARRPRALQSWKRRSSCATPTSTPTRSPSSCISTLMVN